LKRSSFGVSEFEVSDELQEISKYEVSLVLEQPPTKGRLKEKLRKYRKVSS
jgi:hypothetical protein